MSNFRFVLRASLYVALTIAFNLTIHAQAPRTWVSGVGDDANPCSRTAPCKSFAGAISKTAVGGEISALDAGGYGFVVITKSISLDGSGYMASMIAANGANGVVINMNANDAAKSVRLRGLSINGVGSGGQGIVVNAATVPVSVSIEDSVIDGFTGNGISVSGNAQVFVGNTSIRNNGGVGLVVDSTTPAGISNVRLLFNGVGLKGNIANINNVVLYGNKSGDPVQPASRH